MRIYVGNLSYDAVEGDLKKAFGEFGKVESVTILKDKQTGVSKGVAFVEMPEVREGQAAIKGMAGRDFMGRGLVVDQAKEKPPKRSGGGGRGGYGGRSGGGRSNAGGGRRFAGRGGSDDNSGNRRSGGGNRETRDGNRR